MRPKGSSFVDELRAASDERLKLPVIVSLVGNVGRMANVRLIATGNETDWSCVRGCEVHVWLAAGMKAKASGVLLGLHRLALPCLSVWDVRKQRGGDVWALQSGAILTGLFGAPMDAETFEREKARYRAACETEAAQAAELRVLPWGDDENRDYRRAVAA